MCGQRCYQVLVVEQDVYARHAISSYLGWDRRTRVVGQVGSLVTLPPDLAEEMTNGLIDVVLLDTNTAADAAGLQGEIAQIKAWIPNVSVIGLAHNSQAELVAACERAGARGCLNRDHVELALASAICIAMIHPFTVTQDLAGALVTHWGSHTDGFYVLPDKKDFHNLTQRVVQALELVVLDGMPAEVAADEMGVSTSTIRSYVKQGYRVLEDEDETSIATDLSPVERAFQRITSLEPEDAEEADGIDSRAA